jgi:hypothetical protein
MEEKDEHQEKNSAIAEYMGAKVYWGTWENLMICAARVAHDMKWVGKPNPIMRSVRYLLSGGHWPGEPIPRDEVDLSVDNLFERFYLYARYELSHKPRVKTPDDLLKEWNNRQLTEHEIMGLISCGYAEEIVADNINGKNFVLTAKGHERLNEINT